VVLATYRDLFTAIAAAAGSLTGLLFVAMSVTSRHSLAPGPVVFQQVRAAAALLAFTNALAVSLFSLVPGTNAGYPALTLGVIGLLFTAAGLRSVLASGEPLRGQLRQYALLNLLMLIFGTELICGILLLAGAGSATLQVVGYALVTSVIVGIERAWELVGDRDTGIVASLAVLTSRTPSPAASSEDGAEPQPGDPPDSEPGAGALT
jgi:hypothetical protein